MNKLAAIVLLIFILAGVSSACTDFRVKAKDGSVVVGRSMEFALQMNSDIVVYPREGKNKYGYLGVDAFRDKSALVDGINEAGLAVEFLWFTEAKYTQAVKGDKNLLAITELGPWILGNFSSVDEVKRELPRLKVVGVYVPQLRSVPGFHAAVHDAKGNSIVIEFTNGETKIYDNPIGVMTNKPTFDWQLTNLRNYINLGPRDKGSNRIGGVKFEEVGSGSGWHGLPGDWTPPSRFVRTAMMVTSADPARDGPSAVNLAEHILNANDIPLGVVRAGAMGPDYTQWIVIKDLTNKVLYFRSYQDLALKKVEINKLDFKPGGKMKPLPIDDGTRRVIDLTPTS